MEKRLLTPRVKQGIFIWIVIAICYITVWLIHRHFFAIVFAWICVIVEIILNGIGALIWNYWWWNATFPWLIFVLGYLPFFMIAYVVYDLPKLKHQILVVSIMAALVLVSLLVFIPLKWI